MPPKEAAKPPKEAANPPKEAAKPAPSEPTPAEARQSPQQAAQDISKPATDSASASPDPISATTSLPDPPADPTPQLPPSDQAPQPAQSKPLETILSVQPPDASSPHPPSLKPPPYVHHFDTYTLVRSLEDGGFLEAQAVTTMKAVRLQLACNMALARSALVSKSDTENEAYLFRAACSELRTEVQKARSVATDKMRSERTHLQHEVDILNQRVTQETLALKDELKGMFDDRKMAVRMEMRQAEASIQALNNQITIALNSNARSEIESLRWVLTRRAAMAILAMALMILGTLRYASYMQHTQEMERKKMQRGGELGGGWGGGAGGGGGKGGGEGAAGGAAGAGAGREESIGALGTGEVVLG